jgi:cell division inhibitor SepF
MSLRDLWHRTQVYFGIAEEEWEDELYDDDGLAAHEDLERTYAERPNVRRLAPRRRAGADFDEIWSEDERGRPGGRPGREMPPVRPRAAAGNGHRPAAQVHLVVPKTFNDAQQVADKLKVDVPVIVNLQSAESDLAKRLIDFASGLTYALDGSMQRVADRVFLLTPPTVRVSAEEKARLMERGFFNQY